ncbi:MAG TPA: GTPase HflX [Bacteroidota bacterium]|nr:GTPase HflX [Bacteroidota bacterium]
MNRPLLEIRATELRPERALLVGLATRTVRRQRVEENLDELQQLAESAGAVVIRRLIQERISGDPATYIGSGKVLEVAEACDTEAIDLVIFDDDLSPVQVRNLERTIKCKIVDRSGIILDIFASRARTREAKTQVEVAQLEYMLPRLTRQWTHLSRVVGGIGTKGPGETQIETDRRVIRARISTLRARLLEIRKERATQRQGRDRFPRVALVGYTNVGKSTLLNWFTDAGVLVEDRLFATLDSTVRMVELSRAQRVLLSDTVGFIRKLPHQLVASFKSTLDEATEADLLLHVVDISHPLFEEQMAVVNETLEEIGASGKPVISVFNKIDRLQDRSLMQRIAAAYPNSVFISAWRGINMNGLRDLMVHMLVDTTQEYEVTLTQDQYRELSHIHEVSEILEKRFTGKRIHVRFRAPKAEGEGIMRSLKETAARRGH